jgi:peroxiredoxin Q/BCP
VVPDYEEDRIGRGKTRFDQCRTCRFEPICEGPWREYPERMGSAEFQPVEGSRVIDPALVFDDRWEMLGMQAPASTPVGGDWTALVFYPEDGSAACTSQLRTLELAAEQLRERGVTAVGVSPDDERSHQDFAKSEGLSLALVPDTDGRLAAAFRVADRGRFRRTTYLLDDRRRIRHVIVDVDVHDHGRQILAAVERLEAGPRPVSPRSDLVTIRRRSDAEVP